MTSLYLVPRRRLTVLCPTVIRPGFYYVQNVNIIIHYSNIQTQHLIYSTVSLSFKICPVYLLNNI